ncbi:MAG TPA: hydroxymethylglutaryl-CoA lyase [Mycobacteriales bacterium]|nr:hydroxymethylglutaryl-CoA lyase [Mycobacteriales bacterium]
MTPLPHSVSIREVGPRDGLQIEAPVPTERKLELLRALVSTGVPRIEATAFVSPRAVPSMADAADVAAALGEFPQVQWSALVASPGGAARAVAAGVRDLEYVVSVADGHSLANTRRTTDEALAGVRDVAERVHGAGGVCEVILAVAWDCPFDGATPVAHTAAAAARAVALGADRLCLGDTIGTASPARVVDLLDAVRAEVGGVPVGCHFHDTRGMGMANALAAVQAGVTQLDASVGGLGGCPFAPGASGNIATEELVYLLEDAGVETGVHLDSALEAARLARDVVGHELPSGLLRAGGRSIPQARPPADH